MITEKRHKTNKTRSLVVVFVGFSHIRQRTKIIKTKIEIENTAVSFHAPHAHINSRVCVM